RRPHQRTDRRCVPARSRGTGRCDQSRRHSAAAIAGRLSAIRELPRRCANPGDHIVTPTQKLRDLLAEPGVHIMPGCYDGLSAKLVADAGFRVTFMSGFAVSAARLGLPDTGLISFSEMLDTVRNCAGAAAKIPLIGDGDTGYGNALNVQRTVVE